MSNELLLATNTALTTGVIAFEDNDGASIYPEDDTFQDDYQISYLPTLDGKGVFQKKTNDYRIFTMTFPALTNDDFSTFLSALEDALYVEYGDEYYLGTLTGSNYPLPATYTSGTTSYIKVRLVNMEKRRIPNSYGIKVFDLILTFQRVG